MIRTEKRRLPFKVFSCFMRAVPEGGAGAAAPVPLPPHHPPVAPGDILTVIKCPLEPYTCQGMCDLLNVICAR